MHAQRLTLNTRTFSASTLCGRCRSRFQSSQPLSLTLRLAPDAGAEGCAGSVSCRSITSSSPNYHHWLTPQQFAASYGATDDQLDCGDDVASVAGIDGCRRSRPAKTRLTVSGTAAQVQRHFLLRFGSIRSPGHSTSPTRHSHRCRRRLPRLSLEFRGWIICLCSSPARCPDLSLPPGLSRRACEHWNGCAWSARGAIDANTAPILTLSTTAVLQSISRRPTTTLTAISFDRPVPRGSRCLRRTAAGPAGQAVFRPALRRLRRLRRVPLGFCDPFRRLSIRGPRGRVRRGFRMIPLGRSLI